MGNDGECFKTIRESRGITQKEVVQNMISRVTLSKFENNKINISMNNFKYLLDSIDVTSEEFDYIKNNYSYDEKQSIINKFNHAFSNLDDQLVDETIIECEKYLKNNFSVAIKCIKNVMYILKHLSNSSNEKVNCYTKIYAADIWNELSKIDNWTLLDMKIINCCLHFFESKTYVSISELLISNLKKYSDFSDIILLEASVYLNLTILFLMEKDLDKAMLYSNFSVEKSLKSKRIDYIALSLIRNGIILKNDDSIEEGKKLLQFLNDKNLEEQVQVEINYFKS